MIYGDYNQALPNPLAMMQSGNLYAYGVNNPVSYIPDFISTTG